MGVQVQINDAKDYLLGENVSIDGTVMKIHAEPHEIKPGGLFDPFVGNVYVLKPGDRVKVTRV